MAENCIIDLSTTQKDPRENEKEIDKALYILNHVIHITTLSRDSSLGHHAL